MKTGHNDCMDKLNKIKEKYDRKCKNVYSEIVKIQKECQHEDLEYHRDPSGNNDSYYECKLCKKGGSSKKELGGIWK